MNQISIPTPKFLNTEEELKRRVYSKQRRKREKIVIDIDIEYPKYEDTMTLNLRTI